MKNLIVVFLLSFNAFIVSAQERSKFKVLPPNEYYEMVSADTVQLVDVRTPEEYAAGKIEGAENVDYLSADFHQEILKYNKQQTLYIYCRSGNRSAKAAAELQKMGFENIVDLQGGFKAWQEFEKN